MIKRVRWVCRVWFSLSVKSAGLQPKVQGSITVDSDNFLLFELYTITRLL